MTGIPIGKALTGVGLASAVLLGAADAAGPSRFETELRSLRALPFGFTSWCEAGNLIFKGPSSARFRIANAALCAGKPDGHVICAPVGGSGKAAAAPACSAVSAPGT